MENSVITEKAIQENVKVNEKKEFKTVPADLFQSSLSQQSNDDSSTLEQAQEMIAQLKSILSGSYDQSLLMEGEKEKGGKTSVSSEAGMAEENTTENNNSIPPAVGKEYTQFFSENVSEEAKKEKEIARATPEMEKDEASEKSEEDADVLEERLKAVKQLKDALKKELEESGKGKEVSEEQEEKKVESEERRMEKQKSDEVVKKDVKEDEKEEVEEHAIVGDNTKKYLRMKKEIEEGIKALERLKEGGFIDEEDYRKSREILVKKLELADLLLHKETERLTIIKLKERVEKLIDEFMEEEGVKKEKEKLKLYLQALQKLYDQGVVSEEVYNKKRKIIEDKLATYDLVVDEIEMVFNSFLNRIKKEIVSAENELEKLSKHEEKLMKKETEQEKEEMKGFIFKRIFSKKKNAEKDLRYKKVMKELEDIYAKNEGRKTISQLVLLVKKEVENIIGVKEELTHSQLIERIKKDERIDAETKLKLTSFFEKMIVKEYAGEISESDVHEVYEECKSILDVVFTDLKRCIEESKERGKDKKKKKEEEPHEKEMSEEWREEKSKEGEIVSTEKPGSAEEKEEEKKSEEIEGETQRLQQSVEKQQEKKKKSIFQRINEFFGV